MKLIDCIILGIVLTAVIIAVRYMYKKKKSGKCIGCSGDCSHCEFRS